MSEIFVDTIRKTGGTLGTDIRIKNTSVYESDGGTSVTQNLVQGLVKVWFNLQEDDDYRDSFNIASFTDNATGDFTHTFTNSMSNTNFAFTTGTNGSGSATGINSYGLYQYPITTGAGLVRAKNISSGGTGLDCEYIMGMVGGDLA